MAIKHMRIDPAKLQTPTPEDRRRLYEESSYNAQRRIDSAMSDRSNAGHDAMRIHQKLVQKGLFLDMNDLMGVPSRGPRLDRRDVFQGMETGMLTEEFPTQQDDIIMEENYYQQPPRQPLQQQPRTMQQQPRALQQAFQPSPRNPARNEPQQRQSLREQIVGSSRPLNAPPAAAPQAPWRVKAFLGETRNGGEVPIWKVVNAKTGSTIDKMFRLEQVAAKVAGYMNESGDPSDPRAVSVMHTYDKRDQLLKEARVLEKTADGKPMKTERLRTIRAEINQLDYRLGI